MRERALFEIEFSNEQLDQIGEAVDHIDRGVPRVLQGAISRTLRHAQTLVIRKLATAASIGQRSLRKNISIHKPRFDDLVGWIRFGAGRVPIIEMQARQTQEGVTFRGREGRQLILHAFIQNIQGRRGVLRRAGKTPRSEDLVPRAPLLFLKGPSFWRLWETHPQVQSEVAAELQGELEKQTEQRLRWVLQRYGGKA